MSSMVLQVAAKAVIVNDDHQVLVLRESAKHATNTKAGRYQLPGGRLEPGESFFDGLHREVYEETGLRVEPGKPLMVGEWRPVIQGVEHQIISIFMTVGTGKSSKVTISEEHDDYQWVNPFHHSEYDIISPDAEVIDEYAASLAKNTQG